MWSKKIISLITIIFLIVSCSENVKPDDPNDPSKKNGEYFWWETPDGVKKWIKKDKNGEWKPTTGTLTDYWESGEIKSIKPYENGKIEGMLKAYDRKGKLHFDMWLNNSKADSSFVMYYPNGDTMVNMMIDKSRQSIGAKTNFYYHDDDISSDIYVLPDSDYGYNGQQFFYYPNGKKRLMILNDSMYMFNIDGQLVDTSLVSLTNLAITSAGSSVMKTLIEFFNSGEIPEREIIEVGCVKGDCINGKGKFVFPSGVIYEGTFKSGLLNGKGKIFHMGNKIRLEGWFKNGFINGEGIYINEGALFKGYLRKGVKHGYGELSYDDKPFYKGMFVNGEMNDSSAILFFDKGVYYGGVKSGKFHGYGRAILNNGDSLHGTFINDIKHGEFTFYDEEGVTKQVFDMGKFVSEK